MDQKAAVKSKNKKKLSELLPKAVAAVVYFQKPLYSPKKEKKSYGDNLNTIFKSHTGGGYLSSSSCTMIPAEAHRSYKNYDEVQLEQDPTSPKISCIGQIKHHKNHDRNKMITITKQKNLLSLPPPPEPANKMKKKQVPIQIKKAMSFKSVFGGGRKSDASIDDHDFKQPQQHLLDRAPSLSQMRRFASGRDTIANFDWTTQLDFLDSEYDNNINNKLYYDTEDEKIRGKSDDDDVSILFSAPLQIIGRQGGNGIMLEPKKEINLWKRRTMVQPKPLQLKCNTLIH